MKKYLLTWYGITDLKAALGLEKSDGPVLGAIRAGNYTDVYVLAYTNKEKQSPKYSTEQIDTSKEWEVVDAFSNTKGGHELFETWLNNQLAQTNKDVRIQLYPVELTALNDTRGIYDAVNMCLNIVSSVEEEKQVTFYLSPGTPVMAFTWAFASLVNPSLKINVIASSESRKPPETIYLPYELLDNSDIKSKHRNMPSAKFDVIFHLFGEQRIPSVLGILQFKCKMHIFVNSHQYPAEIMKQFIGSSDFKELSVNPFDPKNVEMKILQAVSELPQGKRIGFNLTGGTKLMFAGALAAAAKTKGTPFYFETLNHNLIYLNNFSFSEAKKIKNVETFFKANMNDFTFSNNGLWKDIPERNKSNRINLTSKLWENRKNIVRLYKELTKYNNQPGKGFNIKKGAIGVKLTSTGYAEISLGEEKHDFHNWPDFAKYLSGGWLEEYTYQLLKPYFEKKKIIDLRIGLEISTKEQIVHKQSKTNISWKDKLRNSYGELYQELDIVLTDGKRLYIIECKAGSIKNNDIMKLQNNVRFYGGSQATGILVSAFKPHSSVTRRRIKEARNIESYHDWDLPKKLIEKFN